MLFCVLEFARVLPKSLHFELYGRESPLNNMDRRAAIYNLIFVKGLDCVIHLIGHQISNILRLHEGGKEIN